MTRFEHRRRVAVAATIALIAIGVGAAVAFARDHSPAPAQPATPRIDLASLLKQRGLPTGAAARRSLLRKEIVVLSANDMITTAKARKMLRALSQLSERQLTGGSLARPPAIRALSSLPPQARVPAEVARFVAHVGELTHSAAPPAESARLLRTKLGRGGGAVYGVTAADGTQCFILTGYGGTCASSASMTQSGVGWIVGGAHDGLPGVFVGLAADDVQSVSLNVDGTEIAARLQANIAFSELPHNAHDVVVTTTRGGRSFTEALSVAD